MKHHRLVTRTPRVAVTGGIDTGVLTGSTSLEVKIDFIVTMVDRGITYVFQKSSVF